MNAYDDEKFFLSYTALRTGLNYNDLLETPAMLSLIGDVRGKDIIDLGCGFGKTAKTLANMGAKSILAVDISEKMLKKAEEEYSSDRIEYRKLDLNDLGTISGYFDIAYSSLAFHYIEDISTLLENIRKLLNPGGMLIFSQEHPITTADSKGEFSADNTTYTFSGYLREGKRIADWLSTKITKYHRSLGTIITALVDAGFIVNTVVEPKPDEEAVRILPRMAKEYEKPSFLIIKAYRSL